MRAINVLQDMMRLYSRSHLITAACLGVGYDQKRGLLQYNFLKAMGAAYADGGDSLPVPEADKPPL